MSAVPSGWTATTLGALGNYLNGRGFKKSEWRDSGRPIIRIQNLTGSGDRFNYFQGEAEERYIARPGDLLVSWAATLGAYIWNGPEAVVNQHIFKVESNIDRKFHKYLLDYKLDELMRQTHGSGMVHITKARFDSVPVAIPSRAEQQRIVDILEDHLSQLDAADRGAGSAESKLGVLDLSLLAHVRRSLLDRSVSLVPLGEFCDTALGKMLDAKRAVGEPTPYLRNINVRWGGFDLDDVKTVPLTEVERERLRLRAGDLMVCEGGEPGRCAVWPEGQPEMAYQKALHRMRVTDRKVASPEFVARMLEEFVRTGRADRLFTGTTIKHLPQEKLRLIELPLPDLQTQQAVLDRLEAVSLTRRRMADEIRMIRTKNTALRRALLAAGFSGRLNGRASDMEIVEEMAGV